MGRGDHSPGCVCVFCAHRPPPGTFAEAAPAPVRILSPLQRKPVEMVVSVLRELLQRAEDGELIGLAVAGQTREPGENCTITSAATGEGDVAYLVCAIERVKLRLLGYGSGEHS